MDGYQMYELLKHGKEVSIEVNGTLYQAGFVGQPYGANNCLQVTAPDGTQRRWGWGWNSEVCWWCLDDLEQGWNNQKHPYRPYGTSDNEKENQYL